MWKYYPRNVIAPVCLLVAMCGCQQTRNAPSRLSGAWQMEDLTMQMQFSDGRVLGNTCPAAWERNSSLVILEDGTFDWVSLMGWVFGMEEWRVMGGAATDSSALDRWVRVVGSCYSESRSEIHLRLLDLDREPVQCSCEVWMGIGNRPTYRDVRHTVDCTTTLTATLRASPWSRSERQLDLPPVRTCKARLKGHQLGVSSVAFSLDGQHLVSGGDDTFVLLWDLKTMDPVRCLEGHKRRVSDVALSPDGKYVLSGSTTFADSEVGENSIRMWNVENGEEVLHSDVFKAVTSVVFSPSGLLVAASGYAKAGRLPSKGDDHERVRVWDAATGETVHTLSDASYVRQVAFSADGRCFLALTDEESSIRIWNVENWQETHRIVNSVGAHLSAVAFAPEFNHVVSVGEEGFLRVWDLDTRRQVRRIELPVSSANSIACTAVGSRAVTGNGDGTISVWDLDTGREVKRFTGHVGSVRAVACSADGSLIASAGDDGVIYLWGNGELKW